MLFYFIKNRNTPLNFDGGLLHIVNHNYKDENVLLRKENFKEISRITEITNNKNYIFYINQNDEIYITYDFKAISQLMRIEIAKDLNLLDMYDWCQNYFQNNIIMTIDKIREKLSERSDKNIEER